jgi:hypothetical protein
MLIVNAMARHVGMTRDPSHIANDGTACSIATSTELKQPPKVIRCSQSHPQMMAELRATCRKLTTNGALETGTDPLRRNDLVGGPP